MILTNQQIQDTIEIMLFKGYVKKGVVFSHPEYATITENAIIADRLQYTADWNILIPVFSDLHSLQKELCKFCVPELRSVYKEFNTLAEALNHCFLQNDPKTAHHIIAELIRKYNICKQATNSLY